MNDRAFVLVHTSDWMGGDEADIPIHGPVVQYATGYALKCSGCRTKLSVALKTRPGIE
jgi:hypothetical protein